MEKYVVSADRNEHKDIVIWADSFESAVNKISEGLLHLGFHINGVEREAQGPEELNEYKEVAFICEGCRNPIFAPATNHGEDCDLCAECAKECLET